MNNAAVLRASPRTAFRVIAGGKHRLARIRRFARYPVDIPVWFAKRGGRECVLATAKDLSLGGLLIATPRPAAFGTELVIGLGPVSAASYVVLEGIVRWTVAGGMGIQLRLLGARETRAIVTLRRRAAP